MRPVIGVELRIVGSLPAGAVHRDRNQQHEAGAVVAERNGQGLREHVLPVNRAEYKSVLPDGARRYAAQWRDGFAFGPYTAELTLEYGLQKKTLTAAERFWVVPLVPLAAALGGLALLVMAIAAFLRWYKRRIIAQMKG